MAKSIEVFKINEIRMRKVSFQKLKDHLKSPI